MADFPAALLSDYLAALAGKRWQPGALDCAVFMADWVHRLIGVDPIADIRGTYSTKKQFLRIERGEGGFAASCARRLAACGFYQVDRPIAGDIAVVLSPYAQRRGKIQYRPTGAIAVDATRRAVITSDLGLVIAPLQTVKVYRHG